MIGFVPPALSTTDPRVGLRGNGTGDALKSVTATLEAQVFEPRRTLPFAAGFIGSPILMPLPA
jgi:hypothetical protein